jgi:hypothetical protein
MLVRVSRIQLVVVLPSHPNLRGSTLLAPAALEELVELAYLDYPLL